MRSCTLQTPFYLDTAFHGLCFILEESAEHGFMNSYVHIKDVREPLIYCNVYFYYRKVMYINIFDRRFSKDRFVSCKRIIIHKLHPRKAVAEHENLYVACQSRTQHIDVFKVSWTHIYIGAVCGNQYHEFICPYEGCPSRDLPCEYWRCVIHN